MAAEDERIHFGGTVPRSEVGAHIRDSHVVVIPSLWECWPNTAREALMHNRPVLATPVGGLCEMVEPGRSGWLTRDRSAEAIGAAIAELAAQPGEVRRTDRVRRSAGGLREAYGPVGAGRGLPRPRASAATKRASRRRRPPLVSIVIPYFELDRYVRETAALCRRADPSGDRDRDRERRLAASGGPDRLRACRGVRRARGHAGQLRARGRSELRDRA